MIKLTNNILFWFLARVACFSRMKREKIGEKQYRQSSTMFGAATCAPPP